MPMRIADAAARSGAVVQVGHIERFNPAMRAMEKLEIQPRFIEVTRISPMTFRSIDVGVVLDMMIHDIDIVLRLAQSKVAKIDAVGVSVIGDVEDICNARLTFENGCVANITASRLALKTERRLRVFSSDAYVSLDYQKKLWHRRPPGRKSECHSGRGGENPVGGNRRSLAAELRGFGARRRIKD